ncbi:MAG TPA: L-seryl-tRNA(Sec) selenium transferase, partial [Gemmatimonadota bacterium]|nr:L-seryl-tRNA(Sec) selenium transferase [Gemmatimonadota bacterium]
MAGGAAARGASLSAHELRWLPPVHACLADPPPGVRSRAAGERLERAALDAAIEAVREEIRRGAFGGEAEVRAAVAERWESELAALDRPTLRPLVNATGVVLHTNLGRAPVAPDAAEAAAAAAAAYLPLEYDLATGERGSRYDHAVGLLRILTGAEAAVVVNNNAAALLVAVGALAAGRAVVVSRGELIEIGGGFRIHEIVARSGARLVEVGATNKTHPEDYRAAMEAHDVGAVLKVHRSNFSMEGFVAEVGLEDLCRMAGERGVPVVFDQGTGILEPLAAAPGEPTVRDALEAGATLVCASGDKLLGGPQAGIVCGGAEAVAAVRADPLLRALRVDKATLAALEATLRRTLADPDSIPVRRMLAMPPEALEERARALHARLAPSAAVLCKVAPHAGRAGGGTLPGLDLPGWALRVVPPGGAAALAAALRAGDPPIVARVADDALWLDVRTLAPGEDAV